MSFNAKRVFGLVYFLFSFRKCEAVAEWIVSSPAKLLCFSQLGFDPSMDEHHFCNFFGVIGTVGCSVTLAIKLGKKILGVRQIEQFSQQKVTETLLVIFTAYKEDKSRKQIQSPRKKLLKMVFIHRRIEPKLRKTQKFFCGRVHYPLSHHFTFLEGEWKIDKSKNTFSIESYFALSSSRTRFQQNRKNMSCSPENSLQDGIKKV